jgi:hypothetical protein
MPSPEMQQSLSQVRGVVREDRGDGRLRSRIMSITAWLIRLAGATTPAVLTLAVLVLIGACEHHH